MPFLNMKMFYLTIITYCLIWFRYTKIRYNSPRLTPKGYRSQREISWVSDCDECKVPVGDSSHSERPAVGWAWS